MFFKSLVGNTAALNLHLFAKFMIFFIRLMLKDLLLISASKFYQKSIKL